MCVYVCEGAVKDLTVRLNAAASRSAVASAESGEELHVGAGVIEHTTLLNVLTS